MSYYHEFTLHDNTAHSQEVQQVPVLFPIHPKGELM